jgi:hypothetical protein
MTAPVCARCDEARQGTEKQPKRLAKKPRRRHGNGKGTRVCIVCQELMRRNQNEVCDVKKL